MGVEPGEDIPDLDGIDLVPSWDDDDPAALDGLLRDTAFEEPEDLGFLDDLG